MSIQEGQKNLDHCALNALSEKIQSYSLVHGRIAEITSSDEIEPIENAISHSIPYEGVKHHRHDALVDAS